MKRLLSFAILTMLILPTFAATTVEVYYFHYSRRCATCQAVETESQKVIASLYANEVKEGKVKFIGVNLDEKSSEVLAKKYKVEGQSLLVIGDNKKINLTDKAFMYARTKPDVLKTELKKAVNQLLK